MKNLYLIIFAIILVSCTSKKTEVDPVAYAAEIEAWHLKRVENLKGPNGWLNVSGSGTLMTLSCGRDLMILFYP